MPDLLDLRRVDPAKTGQSLLGKTRRHADAQAARHQLDKGVARRNAGGVEQAHQHGRAIGAAGRLQRGDNLGQAWRMSPGVPGRRIGPDQRYGFGKIADIVVGIAEQHRVHALDHQRSQHSRLHRRDRQVACECGQRKTPVGVGGGREIIRHELQLAVARRRENESVEKFGESLHQSPSSS